MPPAPFEQLENLLRKLEPKARHTTLVPVDCGSTVLLGVSRIAEQHTLVSGRLLVFAYATWLLLVKFTFQ